MSTAFVFVAQIRPIPQVEHRATQSIPVTRVCAAFDCPHMHAKQTILLLLAVSQVVANGCLFLLLANLPLFLFLIVSLDFLDFISRHNRHPPPARSTADILRSKCRTHFRPTFR